MPKASTEEFRVCSDCGHRKHVSEYHGKGTATDGTPKYQSYCRPCANQRRMRRDARDPEGAPKRLAKARRYNESHREQKREDIRRRRATSPEEYRQREADRHLERKYGLTRIEWVAMLKGQRGKCAICKMKFSEGQKICVDHCHTTGRVRGLLCDLCNKGIGAMRDDAELVLSAYRYLMQGDQRDHRTESSLP